MIDTAYSRGQTYDMTVSTMAGVQRWGTARIEAVIKAVTAKAVLVEAEAKIGTSEWCFRCGKPITNPVSRLVGYGPECSEKLFIPRNATPEEARAIIQTMAGQRRETWIPLSLIKKAELLAEAPAAATAAATAARMTTGGQQTARAVSGGTATQAPPQAPARSPEAAGVQLYIKSGRVSVRAPFKYKDDLKATTGARWDKTDKVWTFPFSPKLLESVFALFKNEPPQNIKMTTEVSALIKQGKQTTEAQGAKTKDIDLLTEVPLTRFKPWEHQKRTFNFVYHMMGAMLPVAMGGGKTKITIDLINNRQHRRILICCPLAVVEVWEDELKKHGVPEYPTAFLGLNQGNKTVKQKAQMMIDFLALQEVKNMPAVVAINYESAWREGIRDEILKAGFDFLVLDESHKLKSPSGKASMFLSQVAEAVPKHTILGIRQCRRLGLTGTPLPHDLLDAYAQYRILDKGIFGTNYQNFKQRYAILDQWGTMIRPQNEEEFNKKFYSIAYRVESDVLELPPAQYINRYVKLSPKAMKTYKELEDKMIAEIEGGTVTASNALSKLLRLQQLTSGYLPTEDDTGEQMLNIIDSAKQDDLIEIMDGIGKREPLVVFARFTHDLNQIKAAVEKSGRTYAELSGRMNQLREWKNGDYDVIGVQIQAGGAGVDLTRSRYSVYYSLGYSLGDYMQSRARINRPNQKHPTVSYHILARGTVDQKIMGILEKREAMITAILKENQGENATATAGVDTAIMGDLLAALREEGEDEA